MMSLLFWQELYFLIIQALAPCIAGCCAVNGLVPRTLSMSFYFLYLYLYNKTCPCQIRTYCNYLILYERFFINSFTKSYSDILKSGFFSSNFDFIYSYNSQTLSVISCFSGSFTEWQNSIEGK